MRKSWRIISIQARKFKVFLNDGKTGVGGFVRDITAERKNELELAKIIKANKILADSLQSPLTDIKDRLDRIIADSLKMTDSQYGWICVFDGPESKLRFCSQASSDELSGMPDKMATQTIFLKGRVFEDVKKAGDAFVVNDMSEAPEIVETMPADHVRINRFVFIPSFEKGHLVALLGYANKKTDYEESDIRALKILLTGLYNIIRRNIDEQNLTQILAQRNSMFNSHGAVMMLIDSNTGKLIDCNPAAVRFYGYSEQEFLNLTINKLIDSVSPESIRRFLEKASVSSQKYYSLPHKLKDGQIRYVDVYASPVPYGTGKKMIFTIVFDVSDREKAYKANEYISNHDYLTDLYNRRFLETEFERLNEESHFPLAIMMGDVNGLKYINNSMGHAYGNALLIQARDIFRQTLPEADVIARVDGDEFAVLKTNAGEEEIHGMVKKTEQALKKLKKAAQKNKPFLSIALGYAFQTEKKESLQELMTIAESYLYADKYYDDQSIKSKTINFMMNALFEKSAREKAHSLRVGNISAKIANQLGMSQSQINRVKTAGYLHDIGKIGIDESILNKKGKLTPEEWEIMKSHSTRSYRILQNSGEYSHLGEIVYSHHEKWDGTGYPRGLKGDSIPLEARIISVADSYDAMTSYRTYQDKKSKKEAIDEIIRCSGTQFDPDIVKAFVKLASSAEDI